MPNSDGSVALPLRFRVVPGVWPDVELAPPDGTRADVSASAWEVRVTFEIEVDGSLLVDVGGFRLGFAGRLASADHETFHVDGAGPIELAVFLGGGSAEVIVDGGPSRIFSARPIYTDVNAVAITENVAGFRIRAPEPSVGHIEPARGSVVLDARVFGLRTAPSPLYSRTRAAVGDPGRTFYESESFSVSDACVTDSGDSSEPALVPDRQTIVSPIRVVEEFEWRDTPWGDMTRVADRSEMWRSAVEPGRFPRLETGFRSVDAAFELALETFQRNSTGEFSLPGEAGLWSAGYFQGSGIGFGSWKRDTAHIAIRSGNLLDPTVARASLLHVVTGGFDNGSDGDSLPAVAIRDYFLATGDVTLVHDTWGQLAEAMSVLDGRFDETRGLVRAPHATSNDLFDEPENGGFSLSTEIYSMQAYDAMSRMGDLDGATDSRAPRWAKRAAALRRSIVAQYWNSEFGYFTPGPVGTEAHRRGLWETSGAEASVWGFLGEEGEPMVASVLRAMDDVAMSEYGVVLFPHRSADDHFSNSVWYCWQAGIARAAARVGDSELVHRLIGQQVRTIVRNKTFYEVTNAHSGASWRWPGQLWHAAGFASLLLYGVFGIQYDVDGMRFSPAVSPEFDGARLEGLRYRAAVLDIEIRGSGNRSEVTVDGRRMSRIDPDVSGRHTVILSMTN